MRSFMEEVYKNLSVLNYWGDRYESANTTVFEASEIWLDQASGKTSTKHQIIRVSGLEDWLAKRTATSGSKRLILVARFAWLEIDLKKKCINLPKAEQDRLTEAFGLQLAYAYATSCINGVTALPRRSTPWVESQAYAFNYVPKLVAIWSQTAFRPPYARESLTQGIILTTNDYRKALEIPLEKATWKYGVCAHAMFLPFCISLSFGGQMELKHHEIKTSLQKIEQVTGYHDFHSREHGEPDEMDEIGVAKKVGDVEKNDKAESTKSSKGKSKGAVTATDDYGLHSRVANGHATKLASVVRRTKMVERLLKFVLENLDEEEKRTSRAAPLSANDEAHAAQAVADGRALLRHNISVAEERLAMQVVDMDYTMRRLEIQIEALFHLITWHDSQWNLMLAEASYRDASSMKTLAVVTMLFLPGSFVSSLFSTDLFDWDARDLMSSDITIKNTPQMKLYWAITMPLTIGTFVAYFFWLNFQKRERVRKFGSAVPQPPGSANNMLNLGPSITPDLRRRLTRMHSTSSSFR
ncbi:Notoamide biosynthesis cluster protein M' [Paramyrothecium foliicola]|nr:Notoamide biosynthesis cluster protein M' [Paramyrothecium foliicola]